MSATQVELRMNIKIPLRDGAHLNATAYLPANQAEPVHCVLTLTPYIGDFYHERGMYFAARGIPFIVVDVRGRGNSEGAFQPMIQEGRDAYDVIEWLARQPYCNGQVAMRGGSYCGYCQWAAAKEAPPHLATIVPTAAPYLGIEFPMRNNIFFPYLLQWLTFTSGRAAQANIFVDAAFWPAFYRRWHESGRSFREIEAVLGNAFPVFQEWLNHPEPDAYWDAYNPSAPQYARLQMPILTITGSYDDDQPGALEHYRQHLQHATPAARRLHYLVIGPWDHQGTGSPKAEFGGLRFGAASVIDMHRLHLEWYDWVLQNGPRPEFLRKRVAYYVMGAERWRYADALEDVTAHHQSLYLDSTANANDVFSSGSLGANRGSGAPDWYRFDPRESHGAEIEAEAHVSGGSLTDQSVTFALRGKQLVYHSAPFERDTELSGFFRLSAWISIDCPDTDIYVSVYEIGLDSGSIRLSTDAIRARYRGGLTKPELIRTTAPLLYQFERFTFMSRLIRRGHRLRLTVAPMGRIMEMTFAEKNYNGGGVVAEESVENARPVTVRLFHDDTHASALSIPIARNEEENEASPFPASY